MAGVVEGAHTCVRVYLYMCFIMGWRRLVGSFKVQVSSTEYSLCYRALLQKRPIKRPVL